MCTRVSLPGAHRSIGVFTRGIASVDCAEMSSPHPGRAVPRWMPSPLALFVITLGVILFSVFLAKGPWDSDFYWHVATGELIANGQFPRTDPFSFTWLGMPWTLHEWLGELILYWLVDGLGYMGAVLVYALVTPIAMAILAFALQRYGLRTTAVAIAVSMSALVVIAYATIRPQAVSWIMFAIIVGGLVHLRVDRKRWVLALVPIFIVWANLHGLWAVGLVVLVAYVGMTLVGMTPMSQRGKGLGSGDGAAGGARRRSSRRPVHRSCCTPSATSTRATGGWRTSPSGSRPTSTTRPTSRSSLFMAGIAFFGRWRVPWWMSILAFMGIAMTLLSLRNAPIAALIGAPALAVGLDNALADWRGTPRVRSARLAAQRRIIEIGVAVAIAVAGVVIFVPPDPAARVDASASSASCRSRASKSSSSASRTGGSSPSTAGAATSSGRCPTLAPSSASTGATTCTTTRSSRCTEQVQDADPGWEAIVDEWEVDALLFPPYRAITKGPGGGRRLVRGLPRRERGPLSEDLRLEARARPHAYAADAVLGVERIAPRHRPPAERASPPSAREVERNERDEDREPG